MDVLYIVQPPLRWILGGEFSFEKLSAPIRERRLPSLSNYVKAVRVMDDDRGVLVAIPADPSASAPLLFFDSFLS